MNNQQMLSYENNRLFPSRKCLSGDISIYDDLIATWKSSQSPRVSDEMKADESISNKRIGFRIKITAPTEVDNDYSQSREHIERIYRDIINKSVVAYHGIHGFAKVPMGYVILPSSIMYSHIDIKTTQVEEFSGVINNINEDVAYVSLYDKEGNESFIQISVKELTDKNIECRRGIIFHFLLKKNGEWESTEIVRVEQPKVLKKSFDELVEFYKQEYSGI